MPIGLAQWHNNLEFVDQVFKTEIGFENDQVTPKNVDEKKEIFILSNFRFSHESRRIIINFIKETFSKKRKCFFDQVTNLSQIYYFLKSKFVISPRGVGLDCYRHYESFF